MNFRPGKGNDMDFDLPDIEETPYLLIDAGKMERNLSKMARGVRDLGVKLRPHIKTHKIPRIARRQIELGAVGITVAKLSEAEIMADAGIEDIFVAHPIVTRTKFRHAMDLAHKVRLTLGVDGVIGAGRISEAATDGDETVNVRLEIDTGLRRTGVPYDAAPELAREVSRMPGLRLTGIYTYRGALLEGAPTLDIERAGRDEGEMMSRLADRIEGDGIKIEEVSVGSTPTARSSALGSRVTEVRPGTYVFNDRMQAALGACDMDDCAAAVVATVISRPSKDFAVIDAGSKTFATDVPPGKKPLDLTGFGEVADNPSLILDRLWEEHGTLIGLDGENALEVGERVRIIPNHVCSTVNLHNFAYLEEPNGTCEKIKITARGMLV